MRRIIAVACVVMLAWASTASAFVFKAGGTGEWRVPGANNVGAYNTWAEHTRFRVGDAIGKFIASRLPLLESTVFTDDICVDCLCY